MSHPLIKLVSAFQAVVALGATILPAGEFISFLCVIEREARERKLLAQRDFSKVDREHE